MKEEMRIHHIGIVVKELEAAVSAYRQLKGMSRLEVYYETVPSQKVRICLVKEQDTTLEFIEPLEETSPVFEFMKKGGGLHHICYEVNNIEEAVEEMRGIGRSIMKPVFGLLQKRVTFFYMKNPSMGLRLIELIEK